MSNKLREIENYFLSPNLSQSFLKHFLKDQPRSLQRVKNQRYYYEEKKHFIRGSLVDFFCTLPETEINDLYCIDTIVDKPAPGIMSIINEIVDEQLNFNADNALLIARKQEYQNRQKDETLYNNILKEENYYHALMACEGKQSISTEEWDQGAQCAESILNGEYTKCYFNDTTEYQKAIYKRNLKGLLDLANINHEAKTFRVIDIKTTGEYLESFDPFRFRYDFQISFYNELLQMEYPKYKSLPPTILAVSTKEPQYAEPFEFTEESLNIGKRGGEKNGIYYVGWEEALNNYIYWEEHNNVYNKNLINQKVNYI